MAGGIITGTFVWSVEEEYRVLYEDSYLNLLASENTWWPEITRVHDTDGRGLRFEWLLNTASMEQLTPQDGGEAGGSINFEQLSSVTKEYFPAYHAKGYRIQKMEWLNRLNRGMDPVAKWVGDSGRYAAYYPQRLMAQLILNGANVTGYDGVAFWSQSHPVNPNIASLGTFANTFTGAASGTYPGALPIDDSHSMDVAFTNLGAAFSYIAGAVSQPNGQDVRLLIPKFIIHPPRMLTRVTQLLNASFIAQTAGYQTGGTTQATAAGAADGIKQVFEKWGMAKPIMAKELGASRSYTYGPPNFQTTVTGSDTTYYIVCEEAYSSQLGAFILNRRQPFKLHTYSGESGAEGVDAVLGRAQQLEWHHDAYLGPDVGHPWAIFQFLGS
jgi:hypothetical protein